jgi:drug/metabolite transporter (DMT)-like permease
MGTAISLALLSALGFGAALVSSRIGLRTLDARTGAAISIPTATALFVMASPFALDSAGFSARALLLFVVVGLFFPALVTLLTFRSNEQLGPTITGAVSGTSPLFALLAAALFLGERIPAQATLACVAIAAGILVLTWKQGAVRAGFGARSLLWPVTGAVLRGLAQALAKAGLALWPNPFAAGLIGYLVSSGTVLGASQLRRDGQPPLNRHGVVWFAITGVLNGGAVLLMYGALGMAPVSLVAPIVASYPLITVLLSTVFLREETVTARMVTGLVITVLAVIYLIASQTGAL